MNVGPVCLSCMHGFSLFKSRAGIVYKRDQPAEKVSRSPVLYIATSLVSLGSLNFVCLYCFIKVVVLVVPKRRIIT